MLKNNLLFITKKYWWWLPLICLLALLHSNHFLNSDEGHTLNGAWLIINGKKLYTDFFEFFPPGSYYLLVTWWKIFSVSYLSAKILSLILIFIGAVGLYRLTTYFDVKCWPWLPPLLFIITSNTWLTINHNTFVIPIAIWAIYSFIKIFKDPANKKLYILAGLLVGITGLFLQHKGAALAFSCMVILIILIFKKVISIKYFSLFFASVCVALIPLFLFWPIKTIIYNLIEFPLKHYSQTTFISLQLWLSTLIIASILFLILIKNRKNDYAFLFLGLVQLSFLFSVIQLADWAHIGPILFPVFIMYTMLLGKVGCPLVLKIYTCCAISVVIIISLVYTKTYFKQLFIKPSPSLYENAKIHCPGSIYSGPFLPELYFEFRKINNLPFSTLITNQHTPEQFALAAQLLEKNPPDCLFLNYKIVEKYNYNKNNPVDIFFANNYYLYKQLSSDLDLYLKK